MLKKSVSFVLASLRGSTYRSLRLFTRCGLAERTFWASCEVFFCCAVRRISSQAHLRIVETPGCKI